MKKMSNGRENFGIEKLYSFHFRSKLYTAIYQQMIANEPFSSFSLWISQNLKKINLTMKRRKSLRIEILIPITFKAIVSFTRERLNKMLYSRTKYTKSINYYEIC